MEFIENLVPMPDRNKSGIYKIENKINGKVYVGKTVNFRKRYTTYKGAFKRKDVRQINDYLMKSLEKYRPNNFSFSVLELCNLESLAERELYWMQTIDSTNLDFGYNLRMDSSTGMVTHQSTRAKISERIKREYEDGTRSAEDISEFFKRFWEDNPEIKVQMAQAVSNSRRSYFVQKSRDGSVVAVWDGINQIMNANPDYKWQNIYGAANGSKASYKNFLWERFEELPYEYKDYLILADDQLAPRENEFKGVATSHPSSYYTYTVVRDGVSIEYSSPEMKKIYPNINTAFYRNGQPDCMMYKGVEVSRRKICE